MRAVPFLLLLFCGPVLAQDAATFAKRLDSAPSCAEFLPPAGQVAGLRIGPDKCSILSDEKVFDHKGHIF